MKEELKSWSAPILVPAISIELFLVAVDQYIGPHYVAMKKFRDDPDRSRDDGIEQAYTALSVYHDLITDDLHTFIDTLTLPRMLRLAQYGCYFYEVHVALSNNK